VKKGDGYSCFWQERERKREGGTETGGKKRMERGIRRVKRPDKRNVLVCRTKSVYTLGRTLHGNVGPCQMLLPLNLARSYLGLCTCSTGSTAVAHCCVVMTLLESTLHSESSHNTVVFLLAKVSI